MFPDQPQGQLSTQDQFPGLSSLLEEVGTNDIISTGLPLLTERSSYLPKGKPCRGCNQTGVTHVEDKSNISRIYKPLCGAFSKEAELNLFRPCSTSPKLQLTQLCQLTSAGDGPTCHIFSFVPRDEAHLKSSLLPYRSAADQIPGTLRPTECLMSFPQPHQASLSKLLNVPSASQWHCVRISSACAWLPTLTCT